MNPFRYRGYYLDTENGFYYHMSQYYDPVVHRFVNADGFMSTGTGIIGYNMFMYTLNNPIGFVDSSGDRPCEATTVKDEILENRRISCNYQSKVLLAAEHHKKGTTNPASRQKHQQGQSRKKIDQYWGEKGDERRKPRSNKRRSETNVPEYNIGEKILAGAIIVT